MVLVSLAESTLELPSKRPHLLARVLRADGGPDDGDGEGDGDGMADITRVSSVNVNFAGNYIQKDDTHVKMHEFFIQFVNSLFHVLDHFHLAQRRFVIVVRLVFLIVECVEI